MECLTGCDVVSVTACSGLTSRVPWLQALIMASLRHPNVVLFMGICLDPPCLVTEWCSRGSLYDVIGRAARKDPRHPPLDWMRSLSMALDAAKVQLSCPVLSCLDL